MSAPSSTSLLSPTSSRGSRFRALRSYTASHILSLSSSPGSGGNPVESNSRVRRDSRSDRPPVEAPRPDPKPVPEQVERASETAGAASTHSTESDEAVMTRTRSATTGDVSADTLPSIRFSAFFDPRSNRQSLTFTPISRTLPTAKEVIRVGRYSERENHQVVPAHTPSAAPVGFKSKVVSRRHCEFWYEGGKWFIKDVKSSSGTFLNHIRLSPPGTESRPYIVNDGDIVQLGIDFRGGEEMIFRCVKMRIELNRGWQSKPNTFNMATHKRLRDMVNAGSSSAHAQDCSICLNAIAPCQSLFVAPCSHTWHYKCIRELLTGPNYPIFMCPNCRAAADLDADIEETSEEWAKLEESSAEEHEENANETPHSASVPDPASLGSSTGLDGKATSPAAAGEEMGDVTVMLDSSMVDQQPSASIPIPTGSSQRPTRTPSPPSHPLANGHEGPLTPRNEAGPWVFDGDAGRASQDASRSAAMSSLDAAAA